MSNPIKFDLDELEKELDAQERQENSQLFDIDELEREMDMQEAEGLVYNPSQRWSNPTPTSSPADYPFTSGIKPTKVEKPYATISEQIAEQMTPVTPEAIAEQLPEYKSALDIEEGRKKTFEENFTTNPEYRAKWFQENTGMTEEEFKASQQAQFAQRFESLLPRAEAIFKKNMEDNAKQRGGTGLIRTIENLGSSMAAKSKLDELRGISASLKNNDVWSGMYEGADLLDVLSGGLADFASEKAYNEALKKQANGEELTEEEQFAIDASDLYDDINETFEVLGGRSGWNKVGRATGQSAEFMAGMLPTSGLGFATGLMKSLGPKAGWKAVKTAAGNGLRAALGESLKQGGKVLGRGLYNLGLSYAESIPRAAIMPGTYSRYLELRNERLKNGESLEGNWLQDAGRAGIEMTNEIASEIWGSTFIHDSFRAMGKGLGIDKAMDAIGLGRRRRTIFGWTPSASTREMMRRVGYSGDYLSEVTSELAGDVATNLAMGVLFNDAQWGEMATKEYWTTLLGATALQGAAMQSLNTLANIPEYKRLNSIQQKRDKAVNDIQSEQLRKDIEMAFTYDDAAEMGKALAAIDWNAYNRIDVANAMDAVRLEVPLRIATGERAESERVAKFAPHLQETLSQAYQGVDANNPLPQAIIVDAVTDEGANVRIMSGDYHNPDAMLNVVDMNTGKSMPILASKVMNINEVSIQQRVQEDYGLMFSTEENVERLGRVMQTLDNFAYYNAMTSADAIDIVERAGFTVYGVGSIVTLVDGQQVEIAAPMMSDGHYLVRDANGNASVVGLLDVLQPAMAVVEAQVQIAREQEQQDAAEATEVAEKAVAEAMPQSPMPEGVAYGDAWVTPQGIGRVVEYNPQTGKVYMDINLSSPVKSDIENEEIIEVDVTDLQRKPSEAEMTEARNRSVRRNALMIYDETSDAIGAIQEVEEVAQPVEQTAEVVEQAPQEVPSMEDVPTTADGIVDYDAITDADMYARLLTQDLGSKEEALEAVNTSIEGYTAEVSELQEKAKKEKNMTQRVALTKQAAAVQQQLDVLNQVRDILAPQETMAEVEQIAEAPQVEVAEETQQEPLGLVQDDFTATLPKGEAELIDSLARSLGLSVEFVDQVNKGNSNAQILGNKVLIAKKNRDKAIKFLVGHEFTHRMQDLSPEAYAEFKAAVKEYMGEEMYNTLLQKEIAKYRQHNIYRTQEQLEDEVIADFAGSLVYETDVLDTFIETHADKKTMWQAILDVLRAIREWMLKDTAYDTAEARALQNAIGKLEALFQSASEKVAEGATEEVQYSDAQYSLKETDPATLEALNNGEKIKVYRGMQVIDGKLYPPMSAKVDGKMREPIELGVWERAEERPDLADAKGYFKLDKGNKTSLKARYNPYIHTSLTPLNDQFSSAQDRPNLVTVEVEIPASELTSGYKADKAKDAVGKVEWKAGVVQSQLSGTRTVILSRWDRPLRIVPDSEVAQRIVEMFGDKKVVMPSNVVTPSLRAELEKLGVTFKETDNQGKERYSVKEVNNRFNEELQQQIDGTLPKGHIYKLGMPSDILQSAGIPLLPIELVASRLVDKSMQDNHPFELSEVENLPMAIHNPLVVFRSATHIGSNVILTELKHNASNFVVALKTNKKKGKILINDIRSIHYRKSLNVINWILEDLADYIKPTFEQEWLIPIKNELRSQPQYNSAEVRTKLNDVTKIVQNFENPNIEPRNSLKEADNLYLDAVVRGDMAMAQRMVQEAAEHAGYLPDTSYQGSLAFNGAAPTSNVYFETKEERKQAWDNDEFDDTMSLGDYADNGIDTNDLEWRLTNAGNYRRATQYEKESIDNINKALKNPERKITIYRAVPNSVVEGSVRNGDWVTPSRSYAEYHIGLQDWEGGRVIEQEVSIDDIWWGGDDINEWGYDDGSNYGYRNTENNRKLLDTVTYDDAGNIIPLSERFNPEKADVRYNLKDTPSLVGIHNISLEKLRKAIKMGGLANPSVAVIDADKQTHEDYGEYSLILPKNMVDARQGKNAGTWAGDAWTPTYPQITKRMSKDKDISRFYKDINAMPEAIRGKVRLDFNSFMDGRNANALAYWYLFDKGVAPELVDVPARYPVEIVDALNEATNGSFSMFRLSAEERARCLDAFVAYKYKGDRATYDADMAARKERLENFAKNHDKGIVRKKAQEDLDAINEYGFDYDEVSRFIRDVEWDVRHKGETDVDATIKASMDYIAENNLGAEYDAWRNSLDERYGIEEYIFDGYTNSGTPRYLPHTVENASKWMKKQGRQGAVATFPSFGTFVAVSIPKMTTLESIRKRKNLLGKSKEEYDAFREKWENVYFELGEKLQPDAKGFDDYGYWRLIEAVGQKNPKEYIKKQYNIELSAEDVNTLNEMLNAIRTEYPARYFETKFERPLQLNDFVAAVVPDDVPMDVWGRLNDAKVKIFEYEKGNSNSRAEAMQKATATEGVRFSVKDTFYSNAENAVRLIKQEKATPEQWLKMIEKNGGLKAGEDKWLGLSDWLKASDKKTLTKDEVAFNNKVEDARQIAYEYNIPQAIFITDTTDEYIALMHDMGYKNFNARNRRGRYIREEDVICLNGGNLNKRRELFGTTIHEYTHSVTHKLMDELKAIKDTLNEADILALRDKELPQYKEISTLQTLNEIISKFVGNNISRRYYNALMKGEVDIKEIMSDILNDGEYQEIMTALAPIIIKNLELQKQQYNERREGSVTVIPRRERGFASLHRDGEENLLEGDIRELEEGRRGDRSLRHTLSRRRGVGTNRETQVIKTQSNDKGRINGGDVLISGRGYRPSVEETAGDRGLGDRGVQSPSIGEDVRRSQEVSNLEAPEQFARQSVKDNVSDEVAERLERIHQDNIARINKRHTNNVIRSVFPDGIAAAPIADQVLANIARGKKLRWNDSPDGRKHGLSWLLRVRSDEPPQGMEAVTNGATTYVEDYIEQLYEANKGYKRGLDKQDILYVVMDMFSRFPSPKAALQELEDTYINAAENESAEEALRHIDIERENTLREENRRYAEDLARYAENPQLVRDDFFASDMQAEFIKEESNAVYAIERKVRTLQKRLDNLRSKQRVSRAEQKQIIDEIKQEIRKALNPRNARYFNSVKLRSLINTIDASYTIKGMARAMDRVLSTFFDVNYRLEKERRDALTKSKINFNTDSKSVESYLEGEVAAGHISKGTMERILADRWRGVNSRGISVAKYIDGDTAIVMDFIAQNIKWDESKEPSAQRYELVDKAIDMGKEKNYSHDLIGDLINAAYILEDYWLAEQMLKVSESYSAELEQANKELTEIETEMLASTSLDAEQRDEIIGGLQVALEEALRRKQALHDQHFADMPNIIAAMNRANNSVAAILSTGRVKLSQERYERKKHEVEIVQDALDDLTNYGNPEEIAALDKALGISGINRQESWLEKAKQRMWDDYIWSLDYMLRSFGRFAPDGTGRVYMRFMPALNAAWSDYRKNLSEIQKRIDEKIRSFWGDKSKSWKRGIGHNPFNVMSEKAEEKHIATITYTKAAIAWNTSTTEGGVVEVSRQKGTVTETMDLSLSQAMYLLASWGQSDGRMKLEANGIKEEHIAEVRMAMQRYDERYLDFMDWVIADLLPSLRERYNEVHRQLFGTYMTSVDNYFPLKVTDKGRYIAEDVSQEKGDKTPLSINPGAIINRTHNTNMIDLKQNFFKVLAENISEMERWATMMPVAADINALMSNGTVRNYTKAAFGPSFHTQLRDRFAVATGQGIRSPKLGMESTINTAMRYWASTKIGFRFFTGFKQIASLPAILTYSMSPDFLAQVSVNLTKGISTLGVYPFRYCIDKFPMFRERVANLRAGDITLMKAIEEGSTQVAEQYKGAFKTIKTTGKMLDAFAQYLGKAGFAVNMWVDALSSGIIAMSVYNYEYKRLQKQGYTAEQADKMAIFLAENAFNQTQQSAEYAYLAPGQLSPRMFDKAITVFQNSTFLYTRQGVQGLHEVKKSLLKSEKMRDNIQRREARRLHDLYISQGLSEEEAQAKAAQEARRIATQEWKKVAIHGAGGVAWGLFLGNYIFSVIGNLFAYCNFWDDDDERNRLLWEDVKWNLLFSPVRGFPGGGAVMGFIQYGRFEPFGAMSEFSEDIAEIYKMLNKVGEDGFNEQIAWLILEYAGRWGIGVDANTVTNLYKGIESMVESGMSTEAIMQFLNAPQSQMRLIAGKRREGETFKQYLDRVRRVQTKYDVDMSKVPYYTDEGAFIGSDETQRMTEKQEKALRTVYRQYEEAYRKDVLQRTRPEMNKDWADTEERYKKVVKNLGWTANKNPNDDRAFNEAGEYIGRMPREVYEKLYFLQGEVAYHVREAARFLGDESDYAKYLDSIYTNRKQLIQLYDDNVK